MYAARIIPNLNRKRGSYYSNKSMFNKVIKYQYRLDYGFYESILADVFIRINISEDYGLIIIIQYRVVHSRYIHELDSRFQSSTGSNRHLRHPLDGRPGSFPAANPRYHRKFRSVPQDCRPNQHRRLTRHTRLRWRNCSTSAQPEVHPNCMSWVQIRLPNSSWSLSTLEP